MVFPILLAIAALAAALALGVRMRRQGHALGAAIDRIGTLSDDLDTVRNDRAQQVIRADDAESAHVEAEARFDALETDLRSTTAKLEAALLAYEHAHTAAGALRDQLLVSADAATLWALELARVDRRWHLSVAPGIGLTSPVMSSAECELPHVALDIIAAALREETGTRFSIDWQLTEPLSLAAAVLVVRLGDEMLASSALKCELVQLQVASAGDFVVLTLAAFDNSDAPVTLPELACLSGIGWVPEHSGIARDGMEVRIPLTAPVVARVAA
ncbi:MAG: hypothetical protein F2754_10675 [Actinobacteria bacterium]|uniref:Unannotated protein n=1 Tax=freshwater metagenome TaxID=449393 RepID=A0A6J7ANV8_9ZZZZ|nr:hypothetical protein [Actinomycetota bacterium]MSY72439.1 hypothetical protein [Actinomycetota bacterium]